MGFDRFEPVERRIDIGGRPVSIWRPPDMESLIDLSAFESDERIPYWADVWESAIVLAEDLSAMDGGGRTLLELGCGLGLPAIVAARAGFTVTATDYEETALEGVRYNAVRNAVTGLRTRVLDWRNLPDDLGTFDLVVAADVLYEAHHPAALAATIVRTLASGGLGLVADPCRAKAAGFAPAARAAGMAVSKTRARRPHGATDGPNVEIHRLTFPA
ncbi:MAG: class I SAM-dependent methyltransferase [Planctomycetaceae bacterium]|nr:class I SAM-dependent methyltransferase [Planctomycetaceae bacterium]